MNKRLLGIIVLWKTIDYICAIVATYLLPLRLEFTAYKRFGVHLPYWVWIWGNFDGYHYMEIAERGYKSLEQPFFPLYPYFIHLVNKVFHLPTLISAQSVSIICFIGALIVMNKLLDLDAKRLSKNLFFFIVILFPTAFFYGASYNDSIFLLFASLCIYYSRQKKWFWSSFFAAFATLARLNGLALVFIIILEYLDVDFNDIFQKKNWQKIIKKMVRLLSPKALFENSMLSIVLIPTAFVAYLIYVQHHFKTWHMVFSTMAIWHQDKVTIPIQVFWRYIKIFLTNSPTELTYWVSIIEFLFVIFYIFLIIYSYRKIRFSYWIFFVISIIIPSLTGTFMGMPRYGLHLYPLFLTIALLLQNRPLLYKVIYFTTSIVLLLLCITFFTRGYFIS